MRIRITGMLLALMLASAAFYSCKTTGADTVTTETVKRPVQKEWTRAGFGEELSWLLSEGKNDEAVALFASIPEQYAQDLPLNKLKLSVLISLRRLDEADALATALETAYPADTDVLYSRAVLASARNDGASCTKYLNAVLKINPNHSDALTGLGLDLFSKKSYSQARTMLVRAVSANPANTDALLALGRVYYMENNLDKAQDTLSLAVSKEPGYSVIWAELARVKSENLDMPGAIADIEKAIALDPNVYSHWTDYGSYLISIGRKEPARKAYSEAIRVDPAQYFAYIYRAGLNDDLGFIDEAISDYTIICKVYPQYYYASESLGVLLWSKGDFTGAAAAFRQALSYNPTNISYALMMTLANIRANNEAEAKDFMAKYITTLDRNSTDYFLCRLFLDKSGEMDVINRIAKEKNRSVRNRLMFYVATWFDLYSNQEIAQQYYLDILSDQAPSFFEYRLTQWASKALEARQKG